MLPNINWWIANFQLITYLLFYLMSSSSIGELFNFTSNMNYILKCSCSYIFLNFIIT